MGTLSRILSIASLFGGLAVSNNMENIRYNPNRPKNKYKYGGGVDWDGGAIYIPKRTKFKGWQRENRRSSFNKKKRAA